MRQPLLVLLACVSVASCQRASSTTQSGPVEGWSFVASVGGLDGITHTHLYSLLKAHGIECRIEGSVVYSVSVPTSMQTEAIRVIKDDLRERRYDITLHTGGNDLTYSISEEDWQTNEQTMLYANLIARPDCAASTDLGVLLRTPEMMDDVLAFPYVVRIKSLERQYLDADKTLQRGHEFDIELAVKPDEEIGGKRIHFQVWNHGKHIESLGSNEWWHGSPSEIAANEQKYDKRKSDKAPNRMPRDTVLH